ncbi:MAG TPA: alpha/beta hydrolase, partial [Gemmatimonadales bacterium]|nr:alpha/beta hydrolase [Gemmatimonadales bacterium]
MSPTKPEPLTFLISGQEHRPEASRSRDAAIAPQLPTELSIGTVKQSVSVGVGRAVGGVVPVQALPGEDVVILQIANGPDLILHPETVRDLMLAQRPASHGRGTAKGNGPATRSTTVPTQLGWQGLEDPAVARGAATGLLGRVLLSAVHVVTGIGPKWAASELAEKVDAQVDPGVYRLSREALHPLKDSGVAPGVDDGADAKPLLVLIHGTFSNTSGTFGKLWTAHPQLVGSLFQHYNDRVYGLDHPTLGQCPIANAITLAESLPAGARVHLITHSRGGLVAEVLARLGADRELSEEDLGLFKGDAYRGQREQLNTLADLMKGKEIKVERVVRVACPARGTL